MQGRTLGAEGGLECDKRLAIGNLYAASAEVVVGYYVHKALHEYYTSGGVPIDVSPCASARLVLPDLEIQWNSAMAVASVAAPTDEGPTTETSSEQGGKAAVSSGLREVGLASASTGLITLPVALTAGWALWIVVAFTGSAYVAGFILAVEGAMAKQPILSADERRRILVTEALLSASTALIIFVGIVAGGTPWIAATACVAGALVLWGVTVRALSGAAAEAPAARRPAEAEHEIGRSPRRSNPLLRRSQLTLAAVCIGLPLTAWVWIVGAPVALRIVLTVSLAFEVVEYIGGRASRR